MAVWDERKRASNLAKHGVDFVAAARIFDGLVVEAPDERRDYGERRMKAFGEAAGRVLCVIYTWRQGQRRVISARKANRNEAQAYRQAAAAGSGRA
jgi:uncharacterized DUF497 family protein